MVGEGNQHSQSLAASLQVADNLQLSQQYKYILFWIRWETVKTYLDVLIAQHFRTSMGLCLKLEQLRDPPGVRIRQFVIWGGL